ncbi:hypothetical protein O3Q51_14300 [Cryomorphaceae bacterium 1068]|nr:hypothetical protein [Cryomorphaceae bacterium 1068]
MKNQFLAISKRFYVVITCLIMLSFAPNFVLAQDDVTYDKILMNDGEEKVGKVTAMNETSISFTHKGETLTYTLNKQDVNKIEFSSGRIEFVHPEGAEAEGDGIGVQDHHNLVAVLPFSYISNVSEKMSDQMSTKVQSDCIAAMKMKSKNFKFQDAITTNAILAKHEISDANIASFTPDEIAHTLNVEFVVYGNVTVTRTGSTSSNGNYYSGKKKDNKTSGYTIGTGSTSSNFETTVQMDVYNEEGENIFTRSHQAFWQTNDAYMITLQYIIKRSPFYTK